MTVLVSNTANYFETTITSSVGPTDLVFPVVTTANGPASPAYLEFNPDDPTKREIILCDSTTDATNFRCSAIGKRYLSGSAAGSGLTHAIGTVVRCGPVSQHMVDLHDRVTDLDTRAVLESAFVAKGDIMTATAAGITARLPVGADGTVLEADSTQSLGWKAGGAKIANTLLTTKGDIIAATGASTPARLAAGTDNQVLRAKAAAASGVEYAKVDANSLDNTLSKTIIVANNAARDALTGYEGLVAYTSDTQRFWVYMSGAWFFHSGKPPRFRVTGGAGVGQTIISGSNVDVTWANGTEVVDTEGVIAVGTGVFTCPAAFAGRWYFDYEVAFDPNATGIRATWLSHSVGPRRYAQFSRNNGGGATADAFSGSREIVLAGAETVRAVMYQTSGVSLLTNASLDQCFQGRYVGPA